MSNTEQVAKNLRLENPGTWSKTKYFLKECNKITSNDILLYHYKSEPCSAIFKSFLLRKWEQIRDPQLDSMRELEYSALNRMSLSNPSSQGSENSVKKEMERL